MEKQSLVLLSSEVMISEEAKLHPVFLSATFLLARDVGNLNNESVTKAFIDDLVSRQSTFECLPMYVDMEKLLSGDYDNLTHLYNRVTRKFKTQQFGSLTNFYSETDDDGVTSLYAEARFPKRELEACMRLVELYELGKLCVSVELRYNPEHVILKDGVKYIDAYEDNALTGLCIVSQPAERQAIALDLVAEKNDDNSDQIITNGEEPTNRGETEIMEKQEMTTAEITEETMNAEAEQTDAENQVAVAEGEGASESGGEGASEGGEGASEGGEGASEGGGSGASDGDDSGDEGDDAGGDALTIDPDDEGKTIAEQSEATAEVLEHSVDTHESVENWGGGPVHVIEYHERIIETLEDAGALIAELDKQIAELNEIKSKYDTIIAEQEAKALAEKRENAKVFAQKQGLNVQDTAVAEAIEKLDYEKIAELTMAEEREPEEEKPERQVITLASFVEMEVSDDKYGGLLSRKNK